MENRGFKILEGYEDKNIILPTRKTAKSAGYDLRAAEDIFVEEGKISIVPTGLKAFMLSDEVLLIYIRSSLAVKHNLMLANNVGVIDADYCDHILLPVISFKGNFEIKKGMRIAQGIFQKYLPIDGDKIGEGEKRIGRFGSTGEF